MKGAYKVTKPNKDESNHTSRYKDCITIDTKNTTYQKKHSRIMNCNRLVVSWYLTIPRAWVQRQLQSQTQGSRNNTLKLALFQYLDCMDSQISLKPFK